MTKASTEKYWERRHLQVKAKEIKNTEAYEKALQPELNGLYRELHAEMEKWYVKYANNREMTKEEAVEDLAGVNSKDWGMTLERFERNAKKGRYPDRLDKEYYRSRVARLQDLEQQLQQVAQPYASRETGRMRDGLTKQFENTYMWTNYTVQASKGNFTANFAHFNEAQLRMVVSNPWGKDGKDFSKRIWKNYQQDLPEMLRDSVLKSTLMGYGPQKASQLFHAKFQNFKRSNVHRLVTSEMGHVAEEAAAKGYEENEIEQYEYMATLESHTCDVCGRLDGQKFKLSERKDGINYPLIHPYCRCTTVPYLEDLPEITERWSRDPETGKGKMIKDVKFGEWKKRVELGKMGMKGGLYYSPEMLRPHAVTDVDFDKASRDELVNYLKNNFGMDIKETSRTKLSDFALRETAKMLGKFNGLYQVLPEQIPTLRALPQSEAGSAIAWYSSYVRKGIPVEFGLNVKYFTDSKILSSTVESGVKTGWFSNNSDANHIMMHEFSHHLDSQLTRVSGGNKKFSRQLFDILQEKELYFSVRDIGQYAYSSYLKQGEYTEPFAELFTEAYGPTPGSQALQFKDEFEKLVLEVLNNATSS